MGSRSEWPQSLKDFANRTFAACTDSNRAVVSEELKALIFKSFQEGTIHTTDWGRVELSSLKKKKLTQVKKRSAAASPAASSSNGLSLEEQSRREKRARRFENDELQRQREEEMALRATARVAIGHAQPYASSLAGPSALLGQHVPPSPVGPPQPWVWSAGAAPMPPPLLGPPLLGNRICLTPGIRGSPAPPPVPLANNKRAPAGISMGAGMPTFSDPDVADPNVIDWDEHTVVGTSTKLEKPYLRLTSAPDPKTVRPLPVLEQTLELLKKKWRREQNYAYICDQFKSMRQDLTVQRIKNPFTVKVYEIHARIALEKGDLGEYNQCQSQLRLLYAYKLPGCLMEFLAYRILYLLHTRNRREVNSLMTELEEKHKQDVAVKHALSVRSALVTGNHHKFFALYIDAPNMNSYIMDHFIERERVRALLVMATCLRPHCPLSFITSELAFTDSQEALNFLKALSADLLVEPTPAEVEAAIAAASSTKAQGGFTKGKKAAAAARIPLNQRKWDAKAALPALTAAAAQHRKVDIKGQI
ncbi:hypothetical protein K437DRAFT_292345 [Tilletiaria anomala UBC 951]|uniref:PCI domain-containing protein n=1 Tax=Tilletiaria anomala (strain ATCC 24038 / CBS 436.72 / UBC 951) TaxID=1037660 RepID=A0A066WRY8_TILAU|nr:uncharacterized protein K437DRAFT_292345 [Tilletiaria anomala UBC 951]KDN53425.1 hypothetical protein K437DRAFT_292345 [Tilletiaria anomala UBC 951]